MAKDVRAGGRRKKVSNGFIINRKSTSESPLVLPCGKKEEKNNGNYKKQKKKGKGRTSSPALNAERKKPKTFPPEKG